MLLIADALTVVYLRPYLVANGFSQTEADRVVVWYDPSQVATRNDRAMDADAGFDKMAVSYETWRRAHGFSEAEAPDPTELALRLIIEKGMITPELTEAMIGAVAPDVMEKIRGAAQAGNPAPIPDALNQLLQGAPISPGATPEGAPVEEAPPGLAEPIPAPAPEQPTEPAPPLAEPEAPQA
jgi:hypothetical protein